MSADDDGLADDAWYHSVENLHTPHRITYPSAGAFQHLPLRNTIAGMPELPHRSAHTVFLRDLPAHCYTLPLTTLNFTIVEILVFLPNWFKNRAICAHLMNNDLNANVHFMILDEHRENQLTSEQERNKARKTLTDEYRKTMRTMVEGWTKVKHTASPDWDPTTLSLDGFEPDDVQLNGYRRLPSIPLRDLMLGVKKIPQGTHAGDLTRAIQFSLGSPQDYMFPDDLASILDFIGRTHITIAHTDRPIIRHYVEMKYLKDDAKKVAPTYNVGAPVSAQTQSTQNAFGVLIQDKLQNEEYFVTVGQKMVAQTPIQPAIEHGVHQLPLGIEISKTEHQAIDHPMHISQVGRSSEEIEMEDLLLEHLDHGAIQLSSLSESPGYAPGQLLRECIEGDLAFDGTPLARAARFAQRPDQLNIDWHIGQTQWLVSLLDAARLEGSPQGL
ncbi:hypothetical protein C7974DRAFT_454100 [Boeremia exigua]|uniref:uncharacterized protein n=1 Tax=Boeremia exigua TaxID=749465 RepID=UPI001E8CFD43|nr:uncharacterized protein C7974DRAFT_454100 [Boeremia exigua]KAH6629380.1 hypothetical protein C7974DRAFT_454100 [Boeremia exigua]